MEHQSRILLRHTGFFDDEADQQLSQSCTPLDRNYLARFQMTYGLLPL